MPLQVAENKDIDVPQTLGEEHRKTVQKLYMNQMVKAHEKDLQLFRQEAQKGQSQDLRQFANQNVPKLQSHLETAKEINEQVSASS